jgi:methylphosphonate synthase
MSGSRDAQFLKRQGANFLSIINDLKRNRQATADDLRIPLEQVERIIAGDCDIPPSVIDRAAEVWPINRRDFMIVEDDAPTGVAIMRQDASEASSRIFARGGVDYYEYRDTAMSKLAPLRPEWILELQDVEDDDPESPRLQWNHGHFMHQFTMFVNAVNFYYIKDGTRHVMTANTGDSMYISPFVPHTFATRRRDADRSYGGRRGLILALTYGNKVAGDVQHELSAIGGDVPARFVLDTTSRERYFASLLRQQLDSMTMTPDDAARQAALSCARLGEFVQGRALPTADEYAALARALNVDSRELMPPDAFDEPVVTRRRAQTRARRFGRYSVVDLASIRYLPYSKGLLIELEDSTGRPDLTVPLHQYCYNCGDRPVGVTWTWGHQTHADVLNPDDSVYIKPYVPHAFSVTGGRATLLSLRVGGKTVGDPQRELSHIGADKIRRVYQETSLWYREEKKS